MKSFIKKNTFLLRSIVGSIFVTLALLAAHPIATATTKNAALYSAEIPVLDYSDTERNKAFTVAFKQVVTNVSGSAKHIDNPEIQTKLKDASIWVQSYSYTKNAGVGNQYNLLLQVTFDPNSIPEELKNNQNPTTTAVPTATAQTQNQITNIGIATPKISSIDTTVTTTPDKTSTATLNATDLDRTVTTRKNIIAATTAVSSTPNTTPASPLTLKPSEDIAFAPVISSQNKGYTTQITPKDKDRVKTKSLSSIPTLVWLVILAENPSQNILVDDSNSKTAQVLKSLANSADLDVILPTMDLEDITKITADDICNFDIKIITAASKRYNAQNVVAGCISSPTSLTNITLTNNNGMSITQTNKYSHWMLLTKNKKYRWKSEALDNKEMINQTLNKITQILKPQDRVNSMNVTIPEPTITIPTIKSPVAITNMHLETTTKTTSNPTVNAVVAPTTTTIPSGVVDPNHVVLHINNVNDLDQYAAVVKHLHSLPNITRIELLNITTTSIKLNVTITGGKKTLVTVLGTQKLLIPNSKNAVSTENDPDALLYRWTPKTP